jgi:predicted dehydrogenase
MDGFMWPHHPRTARLRKFLDEGGIGQVQKVIGSFTFSLPMEAENIRLKPETAGGSLLDVGCYPVFGIRWAFGAEPVRAFATAETRHGVDVSMSGLLWLADGRVGVFDCGFTSPLRQWLEVIGTTGVVRVPEMWLPPPEATYEVHREGQPVEVVTLGEADQIVHMLDDFAAAVAEKRDPVPPADEAVRTLRALDALAKSAHQCREVSVG